MVHDSTTPRLIVDPPAAGAWNMAVDEALLTQATEGNAFQKQSATLRLYEWEQPTLSLGYFQSYCERQSHPPSANCPIVRRQSGGGAILHDQEVTYSLIIPPGHELGRDAQRLYRIVHEAIVSTLNITAGDWTPQLWQDVPNAEKQPEPFLCFQRRSAGDVVLKRLDGFRDKIVDHKIVGSAQRRRRGAILQHGSILLDRSPSAPELQGMNNIVYSDLSSQSLINKLCETLPAQLRLSGISRGRAIESSSVCGPLAENLLKAKHSSQEWVLRR